MSAKRIRGAPLDLAEAAPGLPSSPTSQRPKAHFEALLWYNDRSFGEVEKLLWLIGKNGIGKIENETVMVVMSIWAPDKEYYCFIFRYTSLLIFWRVRSRLYRSRFLKWSTQFAGLFKMINLQDLHPFTPR